MDPDSGLTWVYAYPSGNPARVGIQTQIEKKKKLWIPTRAGSPLGNQESVLQEISFSRQQPAARQGAQPSTSNVQPAGRRPLLGGVLRRCTPGGLPEIRGALPRRRAGSRTPFVPVAPAALIATLPGAVATSSEDLREGAACRSSLTEAQLLGVRPRGGCAQQVSRANGG